MANREWRNAATLREAVEELRDEAIRTEGEPVDEWYGKQLDAILQDHS